MADEVGKTQPGGEDQPEPEENQPMLHLQLRLSQESNQRLEKLANYAALEGLIPSDHRGNKTAWINYCIQMGEELLKQHAYKKRGFN